MRIITDTTRVIVYEEDAANPGYSNEVYRGALREAPVDSWLERIYIGNAIASNGIASVCFPGHERADYWVIPESDEEGM